ncbi:MAG: hypothetical protein H0U82_04470 [Actinobacteria bacterium]|nr:hypothetical protein [Actinomycetota bacterium]
MKRITFASVAAIVAVVALGVGVLSATAGSSKSSTASTPHSMQSMTMQSQKVSASDLRSLLGRQLGEHAALAMNATNLGVTGSPAFAATAKALDRNSVELSKSIASVYGAKAGKIFLDGKFMWRAHIDFFVDYTVALAKKDKAGQSKAVANLKTYTVKFGDFLAGATGLPKLAVRNDLLGHVLELKGQIDAYSAKNYPKAATTYRAAFAHMFMTGDLLAGAIAKQQDLPK